jgi:diguanylate cyclase (GGDEF)-like protein/PAS domain S-box-containing protein
MSRKQHDTAWSPESEQRLWALLDLCADYYWQEAPDYTCTLLRHSPSSVAGTNLLGHLPGQTLWDSGFLVTGAGQSWRAHLALREERRDFRELICQVAASSENEAERYLSVSGKARLDDDGSFLGYHCFARDITRQIRSELSLRRFRAAVDMSGDMIYLVDRLTMKFVDINETVCRRTGLSREELLQRGPDLEVLQESLEELEARYDRLILDGTTSRRASTSVDAEGNVRDLETYSRATCIDGRWIIIGVMRDVTRRMEMTRSTAKLQRMYSALTETNAAMLRAQTREVLFQAVCEAVVKGGKFSVAAILTPEGDTLRASAAAGQFSERLMSLRVPMDPTVEEGQGLVGAAFHTLTPAFSNDFPGDPRSLPWRTQVIAGGVASAAAFPLREREQPVGVLLFYSFERDTFDEEILALLVSMADNISFALDKFQSAQERRDAARVLRESEERFRSLTQLSSDFYWEMDAALQFRNYDGHIVNPVNRDAVATLLGRPLWGMPGVEPCSLTWDAFRKLLEHHERFKECEFSFVNSQGEQHFLAFSGEPVVDDTGTFSGYRGIARDVTQRKRLAARMEYLATHDNLTGLPNRTMFNELLSHATRMAQRYPLRAFALFFVDIDHFKQVNDTYGHLLGDALLKEIAGRLRKPLRSTDVVARLGGDEFVILVHEISAQEQIAVLANNVLKGFESELQIEGIQCRVTVSIGISIFGVDASDEHALMTHADAAMYRAKELGKNTCQFYQPPS